MLDLKKIAITGGIASGKSTVCHILEKHGATTLNSDALIHKILEEDPETQTYVVKILGKEVLSGDKLSRDKIAEIVFNDREKLLSLEAHLHPKLFELINQAWIETQTDPEKSLFVVEMPLIQEIGREKEFDLVIAVTAKEAIRKKRFSKGDFDKRMERQWNETKKMAHADFSIVNNGNLETLEKDVLELMKEISAR